MCPPSSDLCVFAVLTFNFIAFCVNSRATKTRAFRRLRNSPPALSALCALRAFRGRCWRLSWKEARVFASLRLNAFGLRLCRAGSLRFKCLWLRPRFCVFASLRFHTSACVICRKRLPPSDNATHFAFLTFHSPKSRTLFRCGSSTPIIAAPISILASIGVHSRFYPLSVRG